MTVAAWSGVPFSFRSTSTQFLGVVPGAAGVGHVNGLEQAENGDGDQVGDEEVRVEEGEGQRDRHQGDEDVPHAALGVLRADADDRFGVLDVGLLLGRGPCSS